jgi:hypothetical protein
MFPRGIKSVIRLLTGVVQNEYSGSADVGTASQLPVVQLVIEVIEQFGPTLLYVFGGGLLALCFLGATLRKLPESDAFNSHVGYISTQVLVGGGMAVVLLATGFFSHPQRAVQYGLFACLLCLGIAVVSWDTVGLSRSRTVVSVGVILLIVLASVGGIFGVYSPNRHMTGSEVAGSEWTISYNGENEVASLNQNYKLVDFHQGRHSNKRFTIFLAPFPDELGQHNSSVAASVAWNDDVLLVTKTPDRYVAKGRAPQLRDAVVDYDRRDLARLNRDKTASEIYTNGNYSVWTIRAVQHARR